MAKYWCANFDALACLEHGIENDLWMMQYQYEDVEHGHTHQAYKKHTISRNWRQLKAIKPGHWFVAYVPIKRTETGNPFYAIGKVIRPRHPKTATDSIKRYLSERRAQNHYTGY